MARKTEEERIIELEKQIEEAKLKKQQLQRRMKEKDRKERTKRLIKVGALFEKHFETESVEKALQIIYSYKESVNKNRDKVFSLKMSEVRESLEIDEKEFQRLTHKNK